MNQQSWVPEGIDTEVPNSTRVYDYLFGGGHNFAADRKLAEQVEVATPGARNVARLNRANIIQADLCEPERVLQAIETRKLLDFDAPIGLLTVSVLHRIPDERRPHEIVAAYRDQLASGSCLVLSHVTADY